RVDYGVPLYNTVTMKNCVMSNLIGTGLSFDYNGFSNPNDQASIALAEKFVAEGKNTKFNQIGFLDIYNWQEINVLDLLPEDLLGSLSPGLNALIRNALVSSSALEKFRAMYKNIVYFHLGLMSTGIMEKSYAEVQMEDSRFEEISSVDVINAFTETPARVWAYRKDSSLSPGKSYSINTKLIDRLHGLSV
ncbi:MAG: hypothetical protein RR338_06165, partial [Clostridia bacterium]